MRTGPRCLAWAAHPKDPTPGDEWALVCDLTRGHHGLHLDRARGVRWRHESPMPG